MVKTALHASLLREGNVTYEAQATHLAGALRVFCSMKQLEVLLIPLEWDASPS